MKKSKIILIAVLAVAGVAVIYFSLGVVKSRYFPGKEFATPAGSGPSENGSDGQAANENQNIPGQESGGEGSFGENASPEGAHLFVTSKDCDNDCSGFEENADDLRYCQEVCGIIPSAPKGSKDECANLEGLEKDYCLRDAAVSAKNPDICDEINDSRVKKTCANRVAEDLLN